MRWWYLLLWLYGACLASFAQGAGEELERFVLKGGSRVRSLEQWHRQEPSAGGGQASSYLQRSSFSPQGLLLEEERYSPDGALEEHYGYRYDSLGRRLEVLRYDSMGAIIPHESYRYFGSLLQPDSMAYSPTASFSPQETEWSVYRYDSLGRKQEVRRYREGRLVGVYSYGYGSSGLLDVLRHEEPELGLGWEQRYHYDSLGHLLLEDRYSLQGVLEEQTRYDALGKKLEERFFTDEGDLRGYIHYSYTIEGWLEEEEGYEGNELLSYKALYRYTDRDAEGNWTRRELWFIDPPEEAQLTVVWERKLEYYTY